jgi:hypothetical protein
MKAPQYNIQLTRSEIYAVCDCIEYTHIIQSPISGIDLLEIKHKFQQALPKTENPTTKEETKNADHQSN